MNERLLSTGIAIFMNTIGMSFGYLSSAYIAANESDNIKNLLLYSSIWMSVPFVCCIMFFRNKPPNVANFSSQA